MFKKLFIRWISLYKKITVQSAPHGFAEIFFAFHTLSIATCFGIVMYSSSTLWGSWMTGGQLFEKVQIERPRVVNLINPGGGDP